MNNVGYALLMTLFAGMATGVGSAIAFVCRRTNTRFLAVALGLSAGVMLYVSFMELMPLSSQNLVAYCESIGRGHLGGWLAAAAFFGGIGLIGLIDKLVPSFENPHEPRRIEDMAKGPSEPASPDGDLCADGPGGKNGDDFDPKFRALHRMGIFSAIAIAIHNFPEGLATFAAAAESPAIGWPVAVAVAIHNIPEGIAVSVPLYYATGSRKKAFVWSLLSGLAEPLGAVLGWLILMPFFTPWVSGALFGVVAGIMVFISLDELLPSAQAYGEHHASIWGLVAGMAVMAVSLLIFS